MQGEIEHVSWFSSKQVDLVVDIDDQPAYPDTFHEVSDHDISRMMNQVLHRLDKQDKMLTSLLEILGCSAYPPSSGAGSDAGTQDSSDDDKPVNVRTSVPYTVEEAREMDHAATVCSYLERLPTSEPERKPLTVRQAISNLVGWRSLEFLSFVVILANAIVVGLEIDISAKLPYNEIPIEFTYFNYAFTLIYFLEMAIKVGVRGCREFFCGRENGWNLLDAVIVAGSSIDILLQTLLESQDLQQYSGDHLRMLRFLRLARISRGVRMIRLLRFVQSLRHLLYSIMATLKSLVWTILLLMLMFYGFSIVFTQGVSDYCREEAVLASGDVNAAPICASVELRTYWSSVGESMLTLFKCSTNGVSWQDVYRPLEHSGHANTYAIFLFFTAFVHLAVLNVVTGTFVQSAIDSATNDREIAVMMQMATKKQQVENIRELFRDIDQDHSEEISIDELVMLLSNERTVAFLESLDIGETDAWNLFQLLDEDMSGLIDIEEFVQGCLQLRGPAKAIHIAQVNLANKAMQRSLTKALAQIETQIAGLSKAQQRQTTRRRSPTMQRGNS